MALTKYKLGDLIEQCEAKNQDLKYGIDDVKGISTGKEFIETKADMTDVNLNSYKIVSPNEFAYVADTSRRGDKIALAMNRTDVSVLISSIYTVFRVKDVDVLHPVFLFMYFNRPEFDRYSRFNSWGSARETFNWEDFCDVEIDLPDIDIQKKYVAIYNSLLANQKSYERGIDDLKLVCDAYIEDLRRKMPSEIIGPYIQPCDERNSNLEIKLAQGITNSKEFADPKQVAESETSAKIVRKGQFAYNRATTRNGEKISIAYREGEDCVVSSAYQVFEIVRKGELLPEYLMMWYKRGEFDRYARYMSKGSAHEFFEYDDMCDVQIPIPDIEIQRSIANIFRVYFDRRQISVRLKEQTKDICPILIKGSIEEAQK